MSNQFWQDGDDPDEVQESNPMRVLREKADADSKVIREMAERLRKMEEKEQRRELADKIVAKGLDPKVAALIPADKNPDEWLNEYAGLFARPAEVEAEPSEEEGAGADDSVSAENAAALAAIAASAKGGVPKGGLDAVEAKIKGNWDSQEEFMEYLQSL